MKLRVNVGEGQPVVVAPSRGRGLKPKVVVKQGLEH